MHDGQNLFDADGEVEPTWGIDVALAEVPWIVVGIDHRGKDRIADDSPWLEPSSGEPARGAAYARFVAREATAFIERTYATTSTRAIAGSSLGGLMALYLGARYPDVFPRVGAFSPTTMWAGSAIFDEWTTQRPERLYVDVGAREYFEAGDTILDYGREVPRFVEHLRSLGLDPNFVLDPDGEHCERDWRRRFAASVSYLLG
jgi:predicted alpha/beta superfamily hydrolase